MLIDHISPLITDAQTNTADKLYSIVFSARRIQEI